MLDMLINFAEEINADDLSIDISKSQDAVFLRSKGAPGIIFKISSLKQSQGGMLNDRTALNVLNEQLNGTGRKYATKANRSAGGVLREQPRRKAGNHSAPGQNCDSVPGEEGL